MNVTLRRSLTSLAILPVIALSGCGNPSTLQQMDNASDAKIVGGTPVSPGQNDPRFYSTVALTNADRRAQNFSFCSGTLIAPRVVLTAAHCLVDENKNPLPGEYLISFGTQVSPNSAVVKAAQKIPHPNYDPRATLQPNPSQAPNDIGLIILEQDAPAGFRPTAVLSGNVQVNETGYIAGFGVSSNRNQNDTGVLRQVDAKIQSVSAAAKRFSTNEFRKGACAGDSGGPTFVKRDNQWFVTGVTSTGAELFGFCLGTNNFTNASGYNSWISQTIQEAGL